MTRIEFLIRAQFWVLEAQFAALVVLGCRELPRMVAAAGWTRRQLWAVVACAILAGTLAATVAPRTNRIYYDEQIYEQIGQSLTDGRRAELCNDGSVEYGRLQCFSSIYNKEPNGYPYLLSVAYRLVGVHEWIAFVVNNAVCAAVAFAAALLAALLVGHPWAAIGAALLVPLAPEQLRWANTAAAEPSAELFTLIALVAAVHFCRTRTRGALMLVAAAAAFAMNMRPESMLVGALVAIAVMLLARGEIARGRLWGAGAATIAASILLVLHFASVRNETWGSPGPRFALSYLSRNLPTNGWFFLADVRFPVVVTLLACVGVWALRRRAAVLLLLAYFAAFWGVFVVFYAGSYDYGADVRYSLLAYPPIFVLGGIGWAFLRDRVADRAGARAATAGALALLVAVFSWYAPLARSVGEESWASRIDVAFARDVARQLPAESFVFSQTPSMFLLWGVDAGQTSLATDVNYAARRLVDRYPGGVYLHWSFWCNVMDPVQQKICDDALAAYPHQTIAETHARNWRYAFYKLDVRPTADERQSSARD